MLAVLVAFYLSGDKNFSLPNDLFPGNKQPATEASATASAAKTAIPRVVGFGHVDVEVV